MRAYELVGAIDQDRQLHVKLPENVQLTQDNVRVLVLLPEVQDEPETNWMQSIAAEWATELADEREDIYTRQDGEPIDAAR